MVWLSSFYKVIDDELSRKSFFFAFLVWIVVILLGYLELSFLILETSLIWYGNELSFNETLSELSSSGLFLTLLSSEFTKPSFENLKLNDVV